MATVTVERFKSREINAGDGASVDLLYIIRGSDDEAEVLTALSDAAPATFDVESISYIRRKRHIEQVGNLLWEGTVTYTPPTVTPTAEAKYQFDTGGGTQHITQSIANIGMYAPSGETAPDFEGAIGVSNDSVDGVDITAPIFHFSETHYKNNSEVTQAYKLILFDLTGKVNDAAFKGFAIGEVLFLGASGSKTGTDNWEITYNFAASKNADDIEIGAITVTTKKGWEYLWIRYADAEDATAKRVVKRPIAAYVEKVYEEGDFSDLDI
jgi:hypothetical protein